MEEETPGFGDAISDILEVAEELENYEETHANEPFVPPLRLVPRPDDEQRLPLESRRDICKVWVLAFLAVATSLQVCLMAWSDFGITQRAMNDLTNKILPPDLRPENYFQSVHLYSDEQVRRSVASFVYGYMSMNKSLGTYNYFKDENGTVVPVKMTMFPRNNSTGKEHIEIVNLTCANMGPFTANNSTQLRKYLLGAKSVLLQFRIQRLQYSEWSRVCIVWHADFELVQQCRGRFSLNLFLYPSFCPTQRCHWWDHRCDVIRFVARVLGLVSGSVAAVGLVIRICSRLMSQLAPSWRTQRKWAERANADQRYFRNKLNRGPYYMNTPRLTVDESVSSLSPEVQMESKAELWASLRKAQQELDESATLLPSSMLDVQRLPVSIQSTPPKPLALQFSDQSPPPKQSPARQPQDIGSPDKSSPQMEPRTAPAGSGPDRPSGSAAASEGTAGLTQAEATQAEAQARLVDLSVGIAIVKGGGGGSVYTTPEKPSRIAVPKQRAEARVVGAEEKATWWWSYGDEEPGPASKLDAKRMNRGVRYHIPPRGLSPTSPEASPVAETPFSTGIFAASFSPPKPRRHASPPSTTLHLHNHPHPITFHGLQSEPETTWRGPDRAGLLPRNDSHSSGQSQRANEQWSTSKYGVWFVFDIINFLLCMANGLAGMSDHVLSRPMPRLILASAALSTWVRLTQFLPMLGSTAAAFNKVLYEASPFLRRFALGMALIYMGFILFGTAVFAEASQDFATLARTTETLFSMMFGDVIMRTFKFLDPAHPVVSRIYLYSYIIFSICIVEKALTVTLEYFTFLLLPRTGDSNSHNGKHRGGRRDSHVTGGGSPFSHVGGGSLTQSMQQLPRFANSAPASPEEPKEPRWSHFHQYFLKLSKSLDDALLSQASKSLRLCSSCKPSSPEAQTISQASGPADCALCLLRRLQRERLEPLRVELLQDVQKASDEVKPFCLQPAQS